MSFSLTTVQRTVKEEAERLYLGAGSKEGGEQRRLETQAVWTQPCTRVRILSQIPKAFGLPYPRWDSATALLGTLTCPTPMPPYPPRQISHVSNAQAGQGCLKPLVIPWFLFSNFLPPCCCRLAYCSARRSSLPLRKLPLAS